ncbi:MAG: hypothetical protein V3V33_14640 [Candidatus Lokiarchaeia archaeon]
MKIAAFITVRLGSTRLPNKALLEIQRKPTIVHLIERIKQAKNLDNIVLCTTKNPEDKKLIKVAEEQNVSFFAGAEKDIIKRHYDAAKHHEINFVINVDGDDLFCDPEYIDEIAEEAKENYEIYDVISTRNLPFGVNSFGYKISCLKNIFEKKKEKDTETGWGEFFKNNQQLNKKYIDAKENHIIDARMTLDYEEDFQFFKTIINLLYKEGKYISLDEITKLLRENPEIIEINKSVEDKYWENYEKKKITRD